MTGSTDGRSHWRGWRIAGWSAAATLLLLPWVAMRFTDEVDWGVLDFAAFGAMLLAAGVACDLAVRRTGNLAYRAGVGVASLAAFLLVWINLAVGIIGSEGNGANLMYAGVLAIAIAGAVIARFRPAGLARALSATALAQTLVGLVALAAGLAPAAPGASETILVLTGFFAALWLLAAWLFLRAARN